MEGLWEELVSSSERRFRRRKQLRVMLEEGSEVVRGWQGRGSDLTYSLFPVPLLQFLVACGNTRHVYGKAVVGSEYGLLDLRVRR